MTRGSDILLIILALIFPPAAVLLIAGCGSDLLVNVLLTILGYLPGAVHAFYLIYKRMQAEERYGRGNFVYTGQGHYDPVVHTVPPAVHGQYADTQPPPPVQPQPQPYYGSTAGDKGHNDSPFKDPRA